MKKVILLFILVILVGCSTHNEIEETKPTAEIEIGDLKDLSSEDISEIYITTLKLAEGKGWVFKRKEITRSDDIEKIIEFIRSIDYTAIDDQSSRYGVGIMIRFNSDRDYSFNFSENTVFVNGKYFGIKLTDDEELASLYEDLDYREKDIN